MFVGSFVFLYDFPLHLVLFKSGWVFVVICLKIRFMLIIDPRGVNGANSGWLEF